ncbi:hypothetical protein [Telmatospirillum siberiense]|nr:hypothetical protein [Telmatospirillum siberiense]
MASLAWLISSRADGGGSLLSSLGIKSLGVWWRAFRRGPTNWSRWGVGCSLLLHGLVVLAILLGLPHLLSPSPPPPVVDPLPVDLVSEGAAAAAAEAGSPIRPASQATDLKIDEKPLAPPVSDIPARKKHPPTDSTTLPLRSRVDRPSRAKAKPPVPSQNGQSAMGPGLTDGTGASGWRSTISIKDFLRAQVERHLEFSTTAWGAADFVVSIHVVLEPDGVVRNAEIVDDPRYIADKLFRSVADSARRAVLVASPLQLPPGRYEAFHDIVLDINPRDVGQ